jgi:acyl-CoA synthetase (AMP-forming)/AMP-acid ligase II
MRMEPDVGQLLANLPPRLSQVAFIQAQRQPGAPALIEAGRAYTWSEFAHGVETSAASLRRLGVRAGDRVMVVGENCAAMVALLFAVTHLDAWAVLVNARLSPREIDGIRGHCLPRRVFYCTHVGAEAQAHALRHAASAFALAEFGTVAVSAQDDTGSPETTHDDPRRQVAALIYTSGTTGAPKAVMLSHRNVLYVARTSSTLRRLSPAHRVYGVLPVSHIYGLASVCMGSLCAGASILLEPRYAPDRLEHALSRGGLTVLQGVPAMYAKFLEHLRRQGRPVDAPTLKNIYAGGSPLDAALKSDVERAFGLPLNNGYGITECTATVTQTRLDAPRADTSAGFPIPGVELRVTGPDGTAVTPGNPGELWVRGPNVMRGYYRDAALTASALRDDGWFDTGDLARIEEDGAVFIVGRTKELIIRSGFNVYPIEVESVLNAHPEVTQSAVVGRCVEGNEEVLAFVELAPGSTATPQSLRDFAAERLSPYKRPSEIVVLPALPASSTGKILKHKLKDMAQEVRAGKPRGVD